jgi:crotonobetainyl-CoA:carnitine CoA-transferase CaiB-like acyl-CoA transferase
LGLDPVVEVGAGDEAVPMIRNPMAFSMTPPHYELPPPALGQDDDVIRAWLTQPRERPMLGSIPNDNTT